MEIKYRIAKVWIRYSDRVTKQEVSCPHIEGIPLYHYLPSSSWGSEGLVLKGLLLNQVQYEVPKVFPETSEDHLKRQEVREWNEELPNWKKVEKSWLSVESLNDKDETRLEVNTTVYWKHPVYGKSWAAPEPKDEDEVVFRHQRATWLAAQKPLWYARAYQEWLKENEEFIQKALEDQGAIHDKRERESEKLKQELDNKVEDKKVLWAAFAKECKLLEAQYGKRITASCLTAFVSEPGKITKFESLADLRDYLEKGKALSLPNGKPRPKKRVK